MNALAISAANLSTLENNLEILASSLGTVSQSVSSVNGQIGAVQGQVDLVTNEVKNLEEEIKKFMIEIKQGTVVSNARQTILMAESEYSKKYGHRDEVRRRVNGLLQSIDITAIKKSTIENISETTIINNPDYWLAPALVSLCAWYTNNKELAEKSLKEAMNRDDEKTSLLFCLVHLRANRIDTSLRWLNRYLSMQDPTKMENKIITVLDAITSGVFGNDAKKRCLEKVNEWMLELDNFSQFKDIQINRWDKYFREKLTPVEEIEFPYIHEQVAESSIINDIVTISRTQEKILNEFKNIMDEKESQKNSTVNKIDVLLHDLVFNYDKEELELKRDIQKNKHIIESNGDMTEALEKFEKTSIALEDNNNFYSHITNVVLADNVVTSLNTKKFAISLSKNFIIEGYKKISSINNGDMLPDLNITINDWTGITKNGSNENELKNSIDKHLDDKFHDEVYGEKLFNLKMFMSIIIGVVAIFFTIKRPIIAALIACVICIFNIIEFWNAYSRRDVKLKQVNELKIQYKKLLSNILAEIVDYYFIYKNSEKNREEFINYINSFNYEDYINNNSKRNIIIDGDK